MRMLLKVIMQTEASNKSITDGTMPKVVMDFVERFKPEATFFTAQEGKRTGFFVFDLKDPTLIPSVAEPFFLNLNASIEFAPVMNLDEMRTGVAKAMGR